ncbi:MAG: hypothetical protein CME31_00395 [Gimesia sp.]|nr:hypothetical protein [Gimesia sp.]
MVPAGYLAKRVETDTSWLANDQVDDIYSLSNCISDNFGDYTGFWKHNNYWLFNSPATIRALAEEAGFDLAGTKLFYYEVFEQQYHDTGLWQTFTAENSLHTSVEVPATKQLEGFDIVTFSLGPVPECSCLSCNYMAETVPVNCHCLLETFDTAFTLLSQDVFKGCEPGPYRIFAVYSVNEKKEG